MRKLFVCILLLTVIKGYSQTADTAEIYFGYKVSKILDLSSRRLDSLRFAGILLPGHTVTIYGYTDFVGGEAYNRVLSAERAKNVKEYLVSLGLDQGDIIHCEGKGIAKANRAPVPGELGYGEDRKVLIIMDRAVSKKSKYKPLVDPNSTAGTNKNGTSNPDPNNPGNKTSKPKNGPKTGTSPADDPNNPDHKTGKTKTGTSPADDPNNPAHKTGKTKTGTSPADDPNDPGHKTGKTKTGTSPTDDPNNPAHKTGKTKTRTLPADDPNNPTDKTGKTKTGTKPNPNDGTAKTGKPGADNPKTGTHKPGTETTGVKTGTNPVTGPDKKEPIKGNETQKPNPVVTNTVTANPNTAGNPTKTTATEPPKMPKPSSEPVIPLNPNKPVPRKAEKNIANLDPKKLVIGEIIPLNNIYFAPASNEMLRQSEPSLEQLFSFLKTNTNLSVEIQGRICCLSPLDGTDEPDGHGSTRSTARAKNIYDYLVTKGIDKNRLTYSGLGNTKPSVYPEKTEYDRDLNRRATMKIIYK